MMSCLASLSFRSSVVGLRCAVETRKHVYGVNTTRGVCSLNRARYARAESRFGGL